MWSSTNGCGLCLLQPRNFFPRNSAISPIHENIIPRKLPAIRYVCIPMKFPAKSLGNGAANTGLAYTRSTNKTQYRTCMNQKKSYCYKNVCTNVRTCKGTCTYINNHINIASNCHRPFKNYSTRQKNMSEE